MMNWEDYFKMLILDVWFNRLDFRPRILPLRRNGIFMVTRCFTTSFVNRSLSIYFDILFFKRLKDAVFMNLLHFDQCLLLFYYDQIDLSSSSKMKIHKERRKDEIHFCRQYFPFITQNLFQFYTFI